jgi:hypothetical protein
VVLHTHLNACEHTHVLAVKVAQDGGIELYHLLFTERRTCATSFSVVCLSVL